MKIAATGIVVFCLWSSLALSPDHTIKFSRPTVKGTALKQEPQWHRQIYGDQYYQFVETDSDAQSVGFFAYDRIHNRRLKLTELSTENAQLGKSFDSAPIANSDFRVLVDAEYANLPIKMRGKTILPDKITFDPKSELYRMYFNSQLNLPISLTSFWVLKSDLDAIR